MKIRISKAQVRAKIDGAWQKSLYALSTEILADCNEYVKRDQNALRDSSLTASEPGKGLLRWETPYAKRQYWEIQTSLTPGTTWKWCETAKRKHKDQWERKAQRGFIENL